MRTGLVAILLLLAACGGGGAEREVGGNNLAGATAGEQQAAAATLSLTATGPGGCTGRWDGQPVTPQQAGQRSAAAVESALSAAGGVANVTREALPAIGVEAPAGLGFACVDSYLSAVRPTGVVSLLLKPAGEAEPALADFTLSEFGAPPPSVVLAVGRGGVLTWNGEPVTIEGITERARQLAGGAGDAIEAPPGELELRPAREANFGQVYRALRAVRQGRIRAALLLPSVPPTPVRPAPPAAPPPAPVPGNQTAPE